MKFHDLAQSKRVKYRKRHCTEEKKKQYRRTERKIIVNEMLLSFTDDLFDDSFDITVHPGYYPVVKECDCSTCIKIRRECKYMAARSKCITGLGIKNMSMRQVSGPVKSKTSRCLCEECLRYQHYCMCMCQNCVNSHACYVNNTKLYENDCACEICMNAAIICDCYYCHIAGREKKLYKRYIFGIDEQIAENAEIEQKSLYTLCETIKELKRSAYISKRIKSRFDRQNKGIENWKSPKKSKYMNFGRYGDVFKFDLDIISKYN